MSRANAGLLFSLLLSAWPAFSADVPPGTTPADEIDPATGFARSTEVRPLRIPGIAPPPAIPAAAANPANAPRPGAAVPPGSFAPTPVPPGPVVRRPHIALILPTASPALGKLAEAVRQGFLAAAGAAGKEAPPVVVTAVENEAQALIDGCRQAQATGALVVVGGLTRDGANSLAASDCPRQPVLALNEPRGDLLPTVFALSLSLEHEARLAALSAVNEGLRSAIVVHTPSPLSRRVEEAFEREWSRAAGEVRRIVYTGSPDELASIRERLAETRADMVFLALDERDAREVRPYLHGALPVFATSMSVNPRAEALVNLDLQGMRYGEMPWFAQPDHSAVMAYPPPRTPLPLEEERLYAFGIDAFRVSLALLKGDPAKIVLDGVTGRIVLEGGHFFMRSPLPVEIDGGKLVPLHALQ